MKALAFFLLFLADLWAFEGLSLSSTKVKNGETLFIEFHANKTMKPISIKTSKRNYKFYPKPKELNHYYALVPFHYDNKLGKKRLTFIYSEDGKEKKYRLKPIELVWGSYKKERLNVDSSKIKLSKKNKKRAEKEYYEAIKLYAKAGELLLAQKLFQAPLGSVITSKFGNERLFNGSRKSYHSGVDYRAEVGTNICAVSEGKVVLVQDRFYAGLSVIVDHGQGVFSCYYHLSKSLVKVGDYVKRKALLGLSGASGRITGPHLHFSMKLHGVTVNPLKLMEQLNLLISD